MGSVTVFVRCATLLFLGALAAIVAFQLLTGRIRLRGLLSTKERASEATDGGGRLPAPGPEVPWTGRPGRQVSPIRIQLLLVTTGVAAYVLVDAVRLPGTPPHIPAAVVLLLAASHALYLAGKFNSLILGRNP